ncbi:MAG: hypothetical protein OXQ28_11365 [Acidobacteriota bacterium]|nr:hypothetical protein [Acidobacteriota bacterium]
MFVHWLVEFPTWPTAAERYWWSGEGNFTWGGQTYRGTVVNGASVVAVADHEVTEALAGRPLTVGVALGEDVSAVRTSILADHGPVPVTVRFLTSPDGNTWTQLNRRYVGRLSGPAYVRGIYQVRLDTLASDVDRGAPRFWSHENQQARHPGDMGLEEMARLASGFEFYFPNKPQTPTAGPPAPPGPPRGPGPGR